MVLGVPRRGTTYWLLYKQIVQHMRWGTVVYEANRRDV